MNKLLPDIIKSMNAIFGNAVERIPTADRYPLRGFRIETIEALKRIHPFLSPLAKGAQITLAFKNGACCDKWLTVGKTADHAAVKSAVKVLSDTLHFYEFGTDGTRWKGLVRLIVGDYELDTVYELAPGTINPQTAHWRKFVIGDDGVSYPQ